MHLCHWDLVGSILGCKATRNETYLEDDTLQRQLTVVLELLVWGALVARSGDSLEDEAKMGDRVATLELEVYRLHREWWPAEPQTQKP